MRSLLVGDGLMPNTLTPFRTLPPPKPWVNAIKAALAAEPQIYSYRGATPAMPMMFAMTPEPRCSISAKYTRVRLI